MSKLDRTFVRETSQCPLKKSTTLESLLSTICAQRPRFRRWMPAFALAALVSGAEAQDLLLTLPGASSNDLFGNSVAGAGDFDNDGFDDIVVGAPMAGGGAGSATVFSGANGSVIATFWGNSLGDNFGASVDGAGDFDNDGFDDIVVGAPNVATSGANSGSAVVISGQTQTPIVTFNGLATGDMFGASVAGMGDFNNDGFDDIVVGAPNESGFFATLRGSVTVYSGQSQAAAATYFGPATNALMGTTVSGAGDFDGDTFDDIAVGIPNTGGIGTVQVISVILGGTVLATVSGTVASDGTGFAVGDVGDVNGDGNDDIIVGMAGATGGGSAQVFLGPNAVAAFAAPLQGPGATSNGTSVAGAGDMDGDGVPDLIVGSLGNYANVYSGLNGALLFTLVGTAGGNFGVSVDGVGQANGIGLNDIVIGDDMTTGGASNSGIAQVFTVFQYQSLCNGDGAAPQCAVCPCGNSLPLGTISGCINSSGFGARLDATGSASVSLPAGATTDLRFTITGAPNILTAPGGALCQLISGDAVAPQNPMNICFGLNTGLQNINSDGLRCAVVNQKRHGSRFADMQGEVMDSTGPSRVWGGEAQPNGGIFAQGGFAAGQTRFFQVQHRENPIYVCGRGLNSSQAIEVTFTP